MTLVSIQNVTIHKGTQLFNVLTMKNQKFGLPGVWIPSEVLLNEELTSTEKLLFGIIANLARSEDGCFAKNEFLAKIMKVHKQSISNNIANLKDKGYLIVEFVQNSLGYEERHIHINPTYPIKYETLGGIYRNLYPPIHEYLPPYKEMLTHNKENINKEKKEINSLPAGKAEAENEQQFKLFPKKELVQVSHFEIFYKLYPRNAQKGKALIAWTKLCTQKNKQAIRPTWKQVRTAIQNQKKTKQWADPTYIPYPSTWINQMGWLNNIEEMNKRGDFKKPQNKSSFGYVGKPIKYREAVQM